jgi:anthranilate synthase
MLKQIKTQGGVHIEFEQQSLTYHQAIEPLLEKLNTQRGALFASSFEYPGRYTCWDIGFYNPPLALTFKQQQIYLQALNPRGEELLAIMCAALAQSDKLEILSISNEFCYLAVKPVDKIFSEEERSQQPSVFTIIREIIAFFKCADEPYLGLYGAFGYDLIFQFESLVVCKERSEDQREMVLYFPDEVYVVNHRKEEAFLRRYDFHYQGRSTKMLARTGEYKPYVPTSKPERSGDHAPGEYSKVVETAKERFACGDLFEVVPSQTFFAHSAEQPSAIFTRMRKKNPSPYGFLINLGEEEYLIGASPEMYVRVQGKRIESCPISGTIKRGVDAIEDAANIQKLLDSEKEFSELTMCTDVDRNDKSRVCEAGSVKVVGRRQIEMYSRLIHTVDHIEGTLRDGFDAVDGFLTHMWVVTVTGAPKLWAMNFIEKHEKSPRRWYGGAVGWFGFDGHLNTGLVLRTMRIKQGIAEIRVGATLLYDSIPAAEEEETQLKASAFLDILRKNPLKPEDVKLFAKVGIGKKVLLVDHQDSFVHTLANYFRQTGADVQTMRSNNIIKHLQTQKFDLIVLSPGPGRPDDFKVGETIKAVLALNIPLFGVCLGLQGIVEYFGGTLHTLSYPMHGKASQIIVDEEDGLLAGLGKSFVAGRYHSLCAKRKNLPDVLRMTAHTHDDIVMAIAHKTLPIYAVQFHPETILSLPDKAGFKIIHNLMAMIKNK